LTLRREVMPAILALIGFLLQISYSNPT